RVFARPGVDVLTEERDLARARLDEALSFVDQRAIRARYFRAASVRDDAVGAELVAALLHGEERRRRGAAAIRQRVELRLGRHVRVGGAPAGGGFGDQRRQPVVGLRADDDADRGRARHDLLALGLGDAA